MLLTLFAGFFLSVPVANAAKPVPITAHFDDDIAFPDYFPGTPTPIGKGPMARITGRMSRFTIELNGFGPCTFTSTEDGIMNMVTYFGTTHGQITVESGALGILTAESDGRVFPTSVLTPIGEVFALGFQGHFIAKRSANIMLVNGLYSGYFIPYNEFMTSGFLYMDFEFQTN